MVKSFAKPIISASFSFLTLLGMQLMVGSVAAQNIGLGTNTPQAKLHVKGTGSGTQIILEENAGTVLRISNEANAAGPYIGTSSNHGFSIVSNNEVRMVFATNGNVGIGLDNPQQRLGIRGGIVVDQDNQNTGTTANTIGFGNNSGEAIGSKRNTGANQYGLDFYTDNKLRLTLTNTGNMGLGTANPQVRLHVKGSGTGTQMIIEDTITSSLLRVSAEPNNTGPYIGTTSNHRFSLVANNTPVIYLTTGGNVGIGLDDPQARVGIRGGIVVDQDNQNTGTITNALRFGNNGGEAIGSRRSAGTNQNGLDFYTANTLRMTVANNGSIGIGTNNPQGLLEIKTGNDRSIKFRHDVVPTMELVSSNANDALAGIMRFRNAIEVMPNVAGTKAGKVDVRNTAGNATITLDGSNGVISAANNAAFGFKSSSSYVSVGSSNSYDGILCEMTVTVPAGGVIYIEGNTDCFFNYNPIWTGSSFAELKIDEYSAENSYITTLKKLTISDNESVRNPVIFASLNFATKGTRKIKLILYKTGNKYSINGTEHMIKAWYYPAVLQVN